MSRRQIRINNAASPLNRTVIAWLGRQALFGTSPRDAADVNS